MSVPDFALNIRSVQVDLARQMETPEFLCEFSDFAAAQGFNSLTLYLEGRIRTPSFPYPAAAESYSMEEIAGVVAHAGSRGLDVMPVVSVLGHANQFLRVSQLAALAETRDGISGRFGPSFVPHVFCPSQPGTLRFLSAYLAEVSSLFPSPYFHVGCDEAWDIGFCPLCLERLQRGETRGDIFAEYLLDIHRLVTRDLGKRMVIWDDMFEWYPDALEKLPRDIVLACWQYHRDVSRLRAKFFHRSHEDLLGRYVRLGFEFLICPSEYTLSNAESFTAYAARYQPLGALLTTWEKEGSFLWQSMPLIAAVGRFWKSGELHGMETALRGAVRDVFGEEGEGFFQAIKALCECGQYIERGTRFDSLLTRRENEDVTARRGLVPVLEGVLSGYREKIRPESRPVLEEMLLSLGDEAIFYDLEHLLSRILDAGEIAPTGERQLNDLRGRLKTMAIRRGELWRATRPGISPRPMTAFHEGFLKKLDALCEQVCSQGILCVRLFLPDQYALQHVRISIRYAGEGDYALVADGVFKDLWHLDCFYSRVFFVADKRVPIALKIETFGYGGQGFTYFEVNNRLGRFVPSAVRVIRGTVSDPGNLLDPDWKWAFAGERDAVRCNAYLALAEAVHGFELDLKQVPHIGQRFSKSGAPDGKAEFAGECEGTTPAK